MKIMKRNYFKKWVNICTQYLSKRSENIDIVKKVRISRKYMRNGHSNIYIDIRDFKYGRPMNKGICFSQKEFEWFLSEIRVKNRKVSHIDGDREVYIDCNNWSGNDYIIYLMTPNKCSVYKLIKKELQCLVKYYKQIKKRLLFPTELKREKTILGTRIENKESESYEGESSESCDNNSISSDDMHCSDVDELGDDVIDISLGNEEMEVEFEETTDL